MADWGCNMCTVVLHSLSSYFTIWLVSQVNLGCFVSQNKPLRQSKQKFLMKNCSFLP
ncbi:hypothetical protein HMPREF9944_01483 [Segatella maculosa OT 289]|uniref:Uncharacterized protein n=1 Tax=Segatella maculosa OT 289 TaxID=999422 RepID=H1HMT9_9BACT|nr:hypothetical protein HMPREF9944_01483 [Segatella maculosa OT 289]